MTPIRSADAVLVRVSPEILELLKSGEAEPVVLLGVEEREDGTHDMLLRTPPKPEGEGVSVPEVVEVLQREVGGCREWIAEKADNCWAPAEFVLWGKLIPPEGLGPRCYEHAAKHVSHSALAPNSGYALIDLCGLAEAIGKA